MQHNQLWTIKLCLIRNHLSKAHAPREAPNGWLGFDGVASVLGARWPVAVMIRPRSKTSASFALDPAAALGLRQV
ncbi:hypothetical protein Ct61P_05880 [Colletotrichum tofieldiae]|nr:hypothetical protein Ct61P_05880 [Colletotrichum tofieldiae]